MYFQIFLLQWIAVQAFVVNKANPFRSILHPLTKLTYSQNGRLGAEHGKETEATRIITSQCIIYSVSYRLTRCVAAHPRGGNKYTIYM